MKKLFYAYTITQVVLFITTAILYFTEVNVPLLIFNVVSCVLGIVFVIITKRSKDDLIYGVTSISCFMLGALSFLISLSLRFLPYLFYLLGSVVLFVRIIKECLSKLWIKAVVFVVLFGLMILAYRIFSVEYFIIYMTIPTLALTFVLSINKYNNIQSTEKPNYFYLGSSAFFFLIYVVALSLVGVLPNLDNMLNMCMVVFFIPSIALNSVSYLNFVK